MQDYEEKQRFCKQDQFAEIKGIYGARQHLCNTAKGEMVPGYEKMDAEEIVEKYREKMMDKF
jgi:hypothetical protein